MLREGYTVPCWSSNSRPGMPTLHRQPRALTHLARTPKRSLVRTQYRPLSNALVRRHFQDGLARACPMRSQPALSERQADELGTRLLDWARRRRSMIIFTPSTRAASRSWVAAGLYAKAVLAHPPQDGGADLQRVPDAALAYASEASQTIRLAFPQNGHGTGCRSRWCRSGGGCASGCEPALVHDLQDRHQDSLVEGARSRVGRLEAHAGQSDRTSGR